MSDFPETERQGLAAPGRSESQGAPEGPGWPANKPLMRTPRGPEIEAQPNGDTAGSALPPSPSLAGGTTPQPDTRAPESAPAGELKTYLGDGVYAELQEKEILLSFEGETCVVIDEIYLGPSSFRALESFAEKIGWRVQ